MRGRQGRGEPTLACHCVHRISSKFENAETWNNVQTCHRVCCSMGLVPSDAPSSIGTKCEIGEAKDPHRDKSPLCRRPSSLLPEARLHTSDGMGMGGHKPRHGALYRNVVLEQAKSVRMYAWNFDLHRDDLIELPLWRYTFDICHSYWAVKYFVTPTYRKRRRVHRSSFDISGERRGTSTGPPFHGRFRQSGVLPGRVDNSLPRCLSNRQGIFILDSLSLT